MLQHQCKVQRRYKLNTWSFLSNTIVHYIQAAGYDLHSAYDYTVPPKGKQLCFTDLKMEIPQGHYGRVAPRSGLAVK